MNGLKLRANSCHILFSWMMSVYTVVCVCVTSRIIRLTRREFAVGIPRFDAVSTVRRSMFHILSYSFVFGSVTKSDGDMMWRHDIVPTICLLLCNISSGHDMSTVNFLKISLSLVAVDWKQKIFLKTMKNSYNSCYWANNFFLVIGRFSFLFCLLKNCELRILRLMCKKKLDLKPIFYILFT